MFGNGNDAIWVILLLLLFSNGGFGNAGEGNDMFWVIIVLLLVSYGGYNGNGAVAK